MTEDARGQDSGGMNVATVAQTSGELPAHGAGSTVEAGDWSSVYEAHFDAVWRTLRRWGVAESAVDDAAQEVFLIAFQRLATFEGRSTLKTWLLGIALHVSRRFRASRISSVEELPEALADLGQAGPQEEAARAEAVRTLYRILDQLEPDKREVFVMAELEQMTVPEIAEATEVTLNTVYSRLRAARRDFNAALKRWQAQDGWRTL